ncbi:MAG: hypothetical protein ABI583_02440 [Betaproteobacteria bacterium]
MLEIDHTALANAGGTNTHLADYVVRQLAGWSEHYCLIRLGDGGGIALADSGGHGYIKERRMPSAF